MVYVGWKERNLTSYPFNNTNSAMLLESSFGNRKTNFRRIACYLGDAVNGKMEGFRYYLFAHKRKLK